MAHGGKRPGAGRKKGTPNKATQARQAKVASTGIEPLDVMIENMRAFHAAAGEEQDVKEAHKLRLAAQECAKDAAPYVHPKLSAIEHSGPKGGPIPITRIELVAPGDDGQG